MSSSTMKQMFTKRKWIFVFTFLVTTAIFIYSLHSIKSDQRIRAVFQSGVVLVISPTREIGIGEIGQPGETIEDLKLTAKDEFYEAVTQPFNYLQKDKSRHLYEVSFPVEDAELGLKQLNSVLAAVLEVHAKRFEQEKKVADGYLELIRGQAEELRKLTDTAAKAVPNAQGQVAVPVMETLRKLQELEYIVRKFEIMRASGAEKPSRVVTEPYVPVSVSKIRPLVITLLGIFTSVLIAIFIAIFVQSLLVFRQNSAANRQLVHR